MRVQHSRNLDTVMFDNVELPDNWEDMPTYMRTLIIRTKLRITVSELGSLPCLTSLYLLEKSQKEVEGLGYLSGLTTLSCVT